MELNNGRTLFNGKTELRYSEDSRKKLVVHSRIEDLSSWNTNNYSLEFGVSHPYTSVDVQVKLHRFYPRNKLKLKTPRN